MTDTGRPQELPATRPYVSDGPTYGAPFADSPQRFSLFEIANIILRRWKIVVGLPAVVGATTAIVVMLVPARYTASAVFSPESKGGTAKLSGVAGLAAQFGVGLPGLENSSQFYAAVLSSRGIQDSVILTSYEDPRVEGGGAARVTLLDIFEIKGQTRAEQLYFARAKLPSVIGIRVDPGTNIVSISVRTKYPGLSAAVANRHLDLLNEFNSKVRETSGRARRLFAETRLAQAQQELASAEADMTRFLDRNRQFQQAPERKMEFARLEREVQVRTDILNSLRQEFEEARLQEVNDVPLITVIDRAEAPGHRTSPRRVLDVLLSALIGGVFGVMLAFVLDYVERARGAERDQLRELTNRFQRFGGQVRTLIGAKEGR